MTTNYGPWATSINAGVNPQLSAFWKKRLTMLVPVSQTSPVLSRRNLLWITFTGAITCIMPTLQYGGSPVARAEETAQMADKASADGKPSELKSASTAEKPVDLNRALALMETQGKRIHTASWHIKQKLTREDITIQSHEISLGVDFLSERFYAQLSGTCDWQGGVAPFISYRKAYSYDGNLLCSWNREQHGKTVPGDDVIPHGIISRNSSEPGYDFKHDYQFQSGLIFFPPFILDTTTARAEYLWKVLKKKNPAEVTVMEDDHGLWRIETPDGFAKLRVRYDPKEGIISSMEWASERPGVEITFTPEEVHREVKIDFQKAGEFMVPKTVHLREGVRQSSVSVFTFDKVSVNRPLDKKDFALDFPEGTNVDDFAEKKTYIENKQGINAVEAKNVFLLKWHGNEPKQPPAKKPIPKDSSGK